MSAERRQFKRVDDLMIVTYRLRAPLEVSVRAGDRDFDAIMLDISEGGLGIDSKFEIPVGSEARLKFTIRNEITPLEHQRKRSIEVDGESRYCRPTLERSFRVGILFKGLSDGDRSCIAEYVNDLSLRKYGA